MGHSLSETYLQQIEAMSEMLARQIGELSDAQLAERPNPSLNPAGFICWHLLRVWDYDLNTIIQGAPAGGDAWHRGGFSQRSGYEPTGKGGGGRGLGFGFTDAEVDEIPYRLEWLRAYQTQLMAETAAYLSEAEDAELGREIVWPGAPGPVSPALRLEHTIAHSWNHIGEIRMTKSMIGFPDPTKPAG